MNDQMLTIDEYIAKMKKADKLNEFDYLKLSENKRNKSQPGLTLIVSIWLDRFA